MEKEVQIDFALKVHLRHLEKVSECVKGESEFRKIFTFFFMLTRRYPQISDKHLSEEEEEKVRG